MPSEYSLTLAALRRDPAAASIALPLSSLLGGEHWPAVRALDEQLAPHLRQTDGLRLEPQLQKKPRRSRRQRVIAEERYDGIIVEQRRLPTREQNLHDLCNALVWSAFPLAKRAMARRQYAAAREVIGPGGTVRLPNARAPEQDALALIDEGSLLLTAPAANLEAARDALRSGSPLPLGATVSTFGHALLEHRVRQALGAIPLTRDARASLLVFATNPSLGADAALASALNDPRKFQRPSGDRGVSLETVFGQVKCWRPSALAR